MTGGYGKIIVPISIMEKKETLPIIFCVMILCQPPIRFKVFSSKQDIHTNTHKWICIIHIIHIKNIYTGCPWRLILLNDSFLTKRKNYCGEFWMTHFEFQHIVWHQKCAWNNHCKHESTTNCARTYIFDNLLLSSLQLYVQTCTCLVPWM